MAVYLVYFEICAYLRRTRTASTGHLTHSNSRQKRRPLLKPPLRLSRYMCVCVCVCVRVRVRVCVCVLYVYYMYIYTHTHRHIHTNYDTRVSLSRIAVYGRM